MNGNHKERDFFRSVQLIFSMVLVCIVLIMGTGGFFFYQRFSLVPQSSSSVIVPVKDNPAPRTWQAPDSTSIPLTASGELIRYGRELIAHTARYLGPDGKVSQISNGMNCQNCHLKSGTKPFGNNYAAVTSTYPRFRERSGETETMEKRINDCIERSLNGQRLDEKSVEMRAIIAWFQWLGKDVKKGEIPPGTGITKLPYLPRPAEPDKGKKVYEKHCQLCHGRMGEGFKYPDSLEWKYPPLAGMNSYNTGAGLYRLSKFAGYVKSNMPHGTTYDSPVLSDEEAWDVAAYINSLPRPVKMFPRDWPDISTKPVDHPFGPYADSFSETQHKYGPFEPIQVARTTKANIP
jgi:Cytochrome c